MCNILYMSQDGTKFVSISQNLSKIILNFLSNSLNIVFVEFFIHISVVEPEPQGTETNKISSVIVYIYYRYLFAFLRILKNNEKGEALQTSVQPFTYLYCNSSFSRQYWPEMDLC